MSDNNFQDLTADELEEAAGGCRRWGCGGGFGGWGGWGGCGGGGWGGWGGGCNTGNGPIVINNVPGGVPGYPVPGVPGVPLPGAYPGGYGIPGVPPGYRW